MKQNRILAIFLLVAGMIFMTASPGTAGAPLPMKKSVTPAPQAPAMQTQPIPQQAPQPIPQQVVKVYSMTVESISLTDQCQLKIVLRNTGAGLSADQHKNSYVKVGQNQAVSLATFDPKGRLRTKGQTKTRVDNTPLTKDTNISIIVTLFNGKTFSGEKLLKPACPPPVIPIPAKPIAAPNVMPTAPTQGANIIPSQTTEGANIIPSARPGMNIPAKPSEAVSGLPVPATPAAKPKNIPVTPMALPETILQVERLGGDLQTWDSWAGTDTSVQKMTFRWKTEINSLSMATWQVSLSPAFPYAIANGPVTPVPPKGQYGSFSIDLGRFSGTYTKPVTFYVRVKPVKISAGAVSTSGNSSLSPTTVEEYDPSPPVRITLTEAGSGPTTEFIMPGDPINATVAPAPEVNATVAPAPEVNATVGPAPEVNATVGPAPEVNATVGPAPEVNATVGPAPTQDK